MVQASRPVWQRRLLGPIVLIGLGVLLLLTNLGYVSWELWGSLWRFWPVLLILLGLELLLTGRASWGSVVFAILVLLAFGVIAGVGFFWSETARLNDAADRWPLRQAFQQPLQDAQQAQVHLTFGAGRLEIADGVPAGLLAEAETAGLNGDLQPRYTVRDGIGRLEVGGRDRDGWWFIRRFDEPRAMTLRLSEMIPLGRLELDLGAAEAWLDLGRLHIQEVDLNAGASSAYVRLPESGRVVAVVDAGLSNLVLEIPEGVEARVRVEGGLSSFTIDEHRFQEARREGISGLATEREYRTSDFESAANRVDLQVNAGAASVEIR